MLYVFIYKIITASMIYNGEHLKKMKRTYDTGNHYVSHGKK